MICVITSRQNNKIKEVSKLKISKYSKENKLFLCEGEKALKMAISAKLVVDVFTLQELNLPYYINQYIVTKEILEKISSNVNPEGVVFTAKYSESNVTGNKLVYLDQVSDPGNMGTIIRTALALGFDGIIYSQGSVSPYNEKVISATKGAIFSLPIKEGKLEDLKGEYQIIVSALHEKSIDIKDVKPNGKFVLVLGNEAHGVSKNTLKLADIVTHIPINNIESLNVAVAGAILMYELK